MTEPHDQPDAPMLIEAVREFLTADVEPQTEGRLRYHLKVAANVLAIVERELRPGAAQAVAHRGRLQRMGFDTDRELATAIRAGTLDDRLAELEPELRETVADKLAVARPDYGNPD
jgi:hypothetical protein